jgi:hypothetical protein
MFQYLIQYHKDGQRKWEELKHVGDAVRRAQEISRESGVHNVFISFLDDQDYLVVNVYRGGSLRSRRTVN